MNRPKLLFGMVAVLAAVWIGLWISGWWGTVTLEFVHKPLGQVLDSFRRQTQLPVLTDMDRTKPVTIRVRRGTVSEALEAIQASAESRGGRLSFLLAADEAGLARLRNLLPLSPEESGIITLEYRIPFPALATLEELPVWRDPRSQIWEPQPGLPRELRALAQDAAQATEIRIYLPADWNPGLQRAPNAGPLQKSLPALARLAGARSEMVYVLPARSGENPNRSEPAGPTTLGWTTEGGSRTPSLPPDLWSRRLETRISALPTTEAAGARNALVEAAKVYTDWDQLPREQRREKIQALMQDPANAERMSDRFSRGLRRLSPEQRSQRYQGYVERRAEAKSGQNQ